MFNVISKHKFANEISTTLENESRLESRSQLLHVRNLLQNTRKNNISCNTPLQIHTPTHNVIEETCTTYLLNMTTE